MLRKRTLILIAALALAVALLFSALYLRPRHGVCVKRNMMFWRINVDATKLRGNLYMLKATGTDLVNANTVALVGKEGVLLVDPGAPEILRKQRAALPSLQDSRIRFVIDSHAHPDHACANGELFDQGAIIVGQKNIQKFFDTDDWAPPRRPGDTPQVVYDTEMTLHFDDERIHLIHPQRLAHTDADTITVFERANVIQTGDLFIMAAWPYMRRSSIDGIIAGQELILKLTNDKTIIVPGHGPLARRADIAKSVWRMREARRRIAMLIDEGLTVEQAVERKPLEDLDPFFGNPGNRRELTMSPAVTRYIYASIKEKR